MTNESTSAAREEIKVKLARWIIFSVLVSLLPVIFSLLQQMTVKHHRISFGTLGAHGEFLLIAVAILAASLGESVGRKMDEKMMLPYIIVEGLNAIFLILAALWFAYIIGTLQSQQNSLSAAINNGKPPTIVAAAEAMPDFNDGLITAVSFGILVFAVLISIGCITVAESGKNE